MTGRLWLGMAGVLVVVVGCGEDPSVNKPVARTGPAVVAPPVMESDGLASAEQPVDVGVKSTGQPEGSTGDETVASRERLVVPFSSANGSTIGFVGSKKIGGAHEGGFRSFTGTFELTGGTGEPTLEKVVAEIDTRSIWSDDEKLTAHLKNQDFFEVDTYPTARFETTSIALGGEKGATHTLTGNLTLHGVTRSITIPAAVVVADREVGLTSEFVLNKEEFGMSFAGPGGVIRHEVVVKLDVKASRGG